MTFKPFRFWPLFDIVFRVVLHLTMLQCFFVFFCYLLLGFSMKEDQGNRIHYTTHIDRNADSLLCGNPVLLFLHRFSLVVLLFRRNHLLFVSDPKSPILGTPCFAFARDCSNFHGHLWKI